MAWRRMDTVQVDRTSYHVVSKFDSSIYTWIRLPCVHTGWTHTCRTTVVSRRCHSKSSTLNRPEAWRKDPPWSKSRIKKPFCKISLKLGILFYTVGIRDFRQFFCPSRVDHVYDHILDKPLERRKNYLSIWACWSWFCYPEDCQVSKGIQASWRELGIVVSNC